MLKKLRLIFLEKKPSPVSYKTSFSQSGEDVIIEYLFGLRKVTLPSFIDIGGYDPVYGNNTYKFYLKGSTGVNIDADPIAIDKFNQVRINDININIGVGARNGVLPFYILEESSLNTFSESELKELLLSGQKLKNTLKIPVMLINEIFEKYFHDKACDLLSVDAEGLDLDIMKSLDFKKYSPKVVCIESINYTPDGTGTKRLDLCSFIESKGYYEYANTNINSIFVNRNWWFNRIES